MNKDQLKELLKQPIETAERNVRCPDDAELASYMDGGLSEQDHSGFELHLADCGYCLERIGLLGRAAESEIVASLPELILARSRKLVSGADRQQPVSDVQTRRRNAQRWAAAAVVVLAIGVLFQFNSPYQATPPAEIRETRNIDPGAMGPNILWPREGMIIVPYDDVFTWTSVPDSIYYKIRIVSDEGDLIWQARVNGTQWGLPEEVTLASGAEYLVRVDAYLAESKSLNSDYVLFRTGQHP